tara:strand:+ start:9956 stop:11023 length:1068 start_codon:yes stop_codon:yes gene_type:complete
MSYYIGLMSGTSVDGVDAALVDLADGCHLLDSLAFPIPEKLRQRLLALAHSGSVDPVADLDIALGQVFADASLALLQHANVKTSDVTAIGSHGQTILHQPDQGITLQIGAPQIIADQTGIQTVANFRQADVDAGGQGAPLAPAFHNTFMRGKNDRVVLNIGGIANITVLNDQPVIGFDTGPGNCLMDAWIRKQLNKAYDANGEWATQGSVNEALLQQLLADNYFKKIAPKSTGVDYFNLAWLPETSATSEDIQRTLLELTATTIINATNEYAPKTLDVIVCGGGVHNSLLMQRLQALGKHYEIKSSADINIDPDNLEAMLFAWLAKLRLGNKPGNLPSVTGAKKAVVLGEISNPM